MYMWGRTGGGWGVGRGIIIYLHVNWPVNNDMTLYIA